MITWLLLHLGIAVIDLDHVARALAAHMLRTHGADVATLEPHGTQRELRRLYAVIATESGLPVAAQAKVGRMAWQYIAAAQDAPQTPTREFSFYG